MGTNTGTLQPTSNPATFSSDNGGILIFDGANDFISTSKSFTATEVAAFSIGIWFKTTDRTGKKLIGFESTQISTGGAWDRHLYIDTDGKLNFGVYNGTTFIITSPDSYADNYWYYAVGTYGNQLMKLYVNGVLVGSLSVAQAQPYTGWWRVAGSTLGGWNKGNNGTFAGRIGPVHAYTKALTAEEVLSNYNTFKSRFYITSSSSEANYRYLKWIVTKRKSSAVDSIQVADFEVSLNGTRVNWGAGATATNPSGSNPANEGPSNILDNNSATKWLDFNFSASATATGLSTLIIDNTSLIKFNSYRWRTANDVDGRDPISWTLQGSNDGTAYVSLASVSDATAIPSGRGTFTEQFTLNSLAQNPDITITGVAVTGGINLTISGATNATSYSIQRATSVNGPWTTLTSTLTSSTFLDTSALNNVTYYYRAKYIQTGGKNSDWGLPSEGITQISTNPGPPFTNLRINCGGSSYTDKLGNPWIADNYFNTGTATDSGTSLAIADTQDPSIYRTQRFDGSAAPELIYYIPIKNGQYQVKFHFAETFSGAFANDVRVFDVWINGVQVLFNLDIFLEAGSNKALIKSVNATLSSGSEIVDTMVIEFKRVKENPTVAGIEITSGFGPEPVLPATPTNLTSTSPSSTQINLTWTDVATNEQRYFVERALGSGDFAVIARLAAGATSYNDTGLSGNSTYRYRIRAGNSLGYSQYSNISTATTQAPPPAVTIPNAPTNLVATVISQTQINLSWTDNATNEVNYIVERSTNGGAFATIVTLGANVSTYNDVAAAASTVYSYRVRATNSAGSSGNSNTVNATTPAPPTSAPTPRLVTFSDNWNIPWGAGFLPDGRLLVTERNLKTLTVLSTTGAKLKTIDMNAILPIADTGGHEGLMDLLVDPKFSTNRYIYWTYSKAVSWWRAAAVARAEFDVNTLTISNARDIYVQALPNGLTNYFHYGCRMAFHPQDETLYVGFADRKTRDGWSDGECQILTSPIGKIIRIDRNGNVPSGNPFPGSLNGEIWSKGHRNPVGLAFQPGTNPPRLWEAEQGEDGGDEINLIESGKDYGWGAVGYGWEYPWRYGGYWGSQGWDANQFTTRKPRTPIGGGTHSTKGFVEPKFIWPVGSSFLTAVTDNGQSTGPAGLMIYSGSVFGQWAGNMFVPCLTGSKSGRPGSLWRLTISGTGISGSQDLTDDPIFFNLRRRVRNAIEGPDGFIYVFVERITASDGITTVTPGTIFVIKP